MSGLQYINLGSVKVIKVTKVLDRRFQWQPHASSTVVQDSQAVTHSPFWLDPEGWRHMWITDEGVQFLCQLTQLQSLELHSMVKVTAAGLASLHDLPALKRLGLEDLHCEISASAVPAFTQLTALTCLKLGWASTSPPAGFDPSVLAHMTQLEELHLRQPQLAAGASGAAELLARLAQLTKLQVLHLACVDCLLQCPPAAFSSLTSSSMLRSLTWGDHRFVSRPCQGWQHMFYDRHLSALTELDTAYGPPWEAIDLDRLVSSCSHLQKLSLCCTPGLQLTALLQLDDLVQLQLRGNPNSSTMASLAQLTGLCRLQRLAVTDPLNLRNSTKLFAPLTALTQLTYLALPHDAEGSATSRGMQQVFLQLRRNSSPHVDQWPNVFCTVVTTTAPAGAPPDVWSQLLSCCEGCAAPATLQHTSAPQRQQRHKEEEEEEEPLAGP